MRKQRKIPVYSRNGRVGCTTSSYDKPPAELGKALQVEIKTAPNNNGLFNETIIVKCNTEQPIKLKIKGNSK